MDINAAWLLNRVFARFCGCIQFNIQKRAHKRSTGFVQKNVNIIQICRLLTFLFQYDSNNVCFSHIRCYKIDKKVSFIILLVSVIHHACSNLHKALHPITVWIVKNISRI